MIQSFRDARTKAVFEGEGEVSISPFFPPSSEFIMPGLKAAGYDPKEDLRYIWSFEIEVKGSNSFYDEDLKGLMEMIKAGRIKPTIDKVLPLEQAAEGLRLIRDREVIGKVVVTP